MLRPKIIISRCFLSPVRYNGGIVNDDFVEKLKSYIDYIDFCPEMDIGLGVPRPKIIIVKENEHRRLIQPDTGKDLTELMNNYVDRALNNIEDADGVILKSKSPSCGVASTKLYRNNAVIGKTDGFFAYGIRQTFPCLPLEDEGRLKNKEIRQHFLTRIFAFSELKKLTKNLTSRRLIEFHSQYKYLLMTYDQQSLKELGQIVADGKMTLGVKIVKYKELFYKAFLRRPSRRRHFNTLMHLIGHISKQLTQSEKSHLFDLVEKYRKGLVEKIVIVELLRSLSFRFENQYILIQKYLNPYPIELNSDF